MSNISNRHNVRPFVSGVSAALSGQRLAKIGYKQTGTMTDKGKIAPMSICVSVPQLEEKNVQEHITSLLPHILSYLETVQDGVIRSIYEGRKYQLDSVSDEEIGVAACISYLTASEGASRWSKEYIESWFTRTLSDNLTVVIAEKLGFEDLNEDQMAVVQKHLNGYKGLFAGLASGKASYQPAQIKGLRRALEVCSLDSESDMVTGKIIGKLDDMEKAQNGWMDLLMSEGI